MRRKFKDLTDYWMYICELNRDFLNRKSKQPKVIVYYIPKGCHKKDRVYHPRNSGTLSLKLAQEFWSKAKFVKIPRSLNP